VATARCSSVLVAKMACQYAARRHDVAMTSKWIKDLLCCVVTVSTMSLLRLECDAALTCCSGPAGALPEPQESVRVSQVSSGGRLGARLWSVDGGPPVLDSPSLASILSHSGSIGYGAPPRPCFPPTPAVHLG